QATRYDLATVGSMYAKRAVDYSTFGKMVVVPYAGKEQNLF
ncbi:MAG: hypothetical protein UU80_C0034G0020, partial [candidate division WWE3 bacterium GW2011_GWA1_41_8]